jgi:hypothetical protein
VGRKVRREKLHEVVNVASGREPFLFISRLRPTSRWSSSTLGRSKPKYHCHETPHSAIRLGVLLGVLLVSPSINPFNISRLYEDSNPSPPYVCDIFIEPLRPVRLRGHSVQGHPYFRIRNRVTARRSHAGG